MRVLITGAQGWLGRFTAAAFLGEPRTEVLGLGRSPCISGFSHRLPSGEPAPLPIGLAAEGACYHYESCDLRNVDRLQHVLAAFRPSYVIHLAGAVSGSEAKDLRSSNIDATTALFNSLAFLDPQPRIIMASSGSIYGEPDYLPQDEQHPINALTDYARSKWKAEQIAAVIARRTGLSVLFARIFNLVGPGSPGSLLPGSLALQLAAAASGNGPRRIRMGPLTTTRDYVDVRDCGAALRSLSHCNLNGASTVNIASGRGTPVSAIWDRLRGIAIERGCPAVEVMPLPPFPANVSVQVGCTKRLEALGFRCSYSIEESLEDLYAWALFALAPPERGQKRFQEYERTGNPVAGLEGGTKS